MLIPGLISAEGQGIDQTQGTGQQQIAGTEQTTGQEQAATQDQGNSRQADLMLPFVIANRCNGCGVCEYYCPVNNEAAIRVRSLAQTGFLSR
jgi:Pyruvate/2-oxoacid:ferredoxin oxidoreductase delta subunit